MAAKHGRLPFRGITAPASLKQGRPGRAVAEPGRPFRGITAPASLKLQGALARVHLPAPFPGHYCPGLIEARSAFACRAPQYRSFRGITAPASLKRCKVLRNGDTGRCPFRGITAPASLKRPPRVGVGRTRAAFPGHYCPGLIEASAAPVRSIASPAFPGHYCPGLIEALLLPMRGGWNYPLSGALLPRPH